MKSTRRIIENKVERYLADSGISPSSGILVAFSGGIDSTALLAVLTSLEGREHKITAAYYNHGLRDEARLEDEERTVAELAEAAGAGLLIGRAGRSEIKSLARKERLSTEDAARRLRYEFLAEAAGKSGCDYIATAHHLDDNAETMIMRFMQGAGPAGLSGIPERRGRIIRPLIEVSRAEIESYLRIKHLSFSRDETNDGDDYLRNRIRHKIVPAMRDVVPDFADNLCRLSARIRMHNDFVAREAERRLVWRYEAGRYGIDIESFLSADPVLRVHSLYTVLNKVDPENGRISFKSVEKVACAGNIGSGKILLRVGAAEIAAEHGSIYISRLVNRVKKSYLLYLKPNMELSVCGQIFGMFERPEDKKESELMHVGVIPPVIVRSFREGDSIRIKSGRKSVKKLFSEWRVNKHDRSMIPVVEDGRGIVAVAGGHLGYSDIAAHGRKNTERGLTEVELTFRSTTETTGE